MAAFFFLTMILGGGTVGLVLSGVLPAGVTLASALSPSVAKIIMTVVEEGRAGLKLMMRRLMIWRVGIGYWMVACLFFVPAILLGSLANLLFNGDPFSLSSIQPAFAIVPMFIVFFIIAGLGEELGFTG